MVIRLTNAGHLGCWEAHADDRLGKGLRMEARVDAVRNGRSRKIREERTFEGIMDARERTSVRMRDDGLRDDGMTDDG